jgi:nitroimidazol reductase NimA-like FMN-containing flavoprotein (pyridoxamine 5'-phosphate oxidase superfamily)
MVSAAGQKAGTVLHTIVDRRKPMFRKMRRFNQQISEKECKEVLNQEKRGVLSVLGDDGYPYGLPIDYIYDEEDGKLYFHGAKSGHKIDAIRACDKASFCVWDEGYRKEGEWSLNIKSVIIFGRIRPVEDHEQALAICEKLCHKFTDDEAYIQHELQHSGPAVQCLELSIEHMTGKLVNES